jgi:hypothetical protein
MNGRGLPRGFRSNGSGTCCILGLMSELVLPGP